MGLEVYYLPHKDFRSHTNDVVLWPTGVCQGTEIDSHETDLMGANVIQFTAHGLIKADIPRWECIFTFCSRMPGGGETREFSNCQRILLPTFWWCADALFQCSHTNISPIQVCCGLSSVYDSKCWNVALKQTDIFPLFTIYQPAKISIKIYLIFI